MNGTPIHLHSLFPLPDPNSRDAPLQANREQIGVTLMDEFPSQHKHRTQPPRDLQRGLWHRLTLTCWAQLWSVPEPAVEPGMSRVRWTCRCGKMMYDDYRELKQGEVNEMEIYLNCLYKNTKGGQESGRGSGPFRTCLAWVSNHLSQGWTSSKNRTDSSLPMTRINNQTASQSNCATRSSPQDPRFLLICANLGKRVPTLVQENACNIGSDQHLFNLLKKTYRQKRSRIRSSISLRTVVDIKLVQVCHYRHIESCCGESAIRPSNR